MADTYPTKLDKAGIEFLIEHEGEVLYAYNDPAGHATFGVGHLLHQGRVNSSDRVRYGTKERPKPRDEMRKLSRKLLAADTAKHESAVRNLVPGRWRGSQDRFNALVSLSFNLGTGILTPEPPLTSFGKALQGEGVEARERIAAAFLLYDKADGKRLPGLTKRRKAERALFLKSWR